MTANSFHLVVYEVVPQPDGDLRQRPLYGHTLSLSTGLWGPQHRAEAHRVLDELLDKSFHLLNHGY